jgi:uroporphyrinogen III methyltransferase/synthase
MSGTLPAQRVVTAPLGELAAEVERQGIGAPAVAVVGDVVLLRDALAWYERQPLFGCRVLVTRAPEQAGELASALAQAGAEAVLAPLVRLAPLEDSALLDTAIDRLADYDAIVFTSANAVRFTALRAAQRGLALDTGAARVVCVGPATAEAALEAGLPVHRAPPARFDAEAVLEQLLSDESVRGQRFLVPRSDLARDTLPDGLRAAGAQVDAVVAYRNVAAEVDGAWLRGQLVDGGLDALTFASPSAAQRFCALLDSRSREAAARSVVAAIGPVTARALAAAGLPAQVVARSATASGLVAELALAMAARAEAD